MDKNKILSLIYDKVKEEYKNNDMSENPCVFYLDEETDTLNRVEEYFKS